MFCPRINGVCKYEECPDYLNLERDYCLDSLYKKHQLGILSFEEKRALGRVAVGNLNKQMTGSRR